MPSPPLSRTESSALLAFGTFVRAEFGERVRALRLFGSRARGEGHEESDLDVFVLVNAMNRSERRTLRDAAYDVGLRHHVVLDGLRALIGEHFIRPGVLAPEHGRTLARTAGDRNDADYNVAAVFTALDVTEDLTRAAAFVEAVERIVEEKPEA